MEHKPTGHRRHHEGPSLATFEIVWTSKRIMCVIYCNALNK